MAGKPSLRSQIIGAWELQDYSAHLASDPSNKIYPLGPNATGIIMYTPSGHMSAQLRRPGQANFGPGSDGVSVATDAEWAEVGRNYVAYTGRFFLDESGDEVFLNHEMRYSNLPNLNGDVQRRTVEITDEADGRFLNLGVKGEMDFGGEKRIVKVKWKRMEQNDQAKPQAKL